MAAEGFSFPPPPPPPPVSASSARPSEPANRGRGRGRGGGHGNFLGARGRGGSGGRGRGRGQHPHSQGRRWGVLPPGTDSPAPHAHLPQAFNGGASNSSPMAHLQKRPLDNALEATTSSQSHKTSLPSSTPAVPSFGYQPPVVPVATEPQEKKRKTNLLGLTPSITADKEDSPEVDDEEARLKQSAQSDGALEFSYRGRTATLSTKEDIAAWIEERKRRYPTAARITAKQREEEEKKEKAVEAQARKKEVDRREKREPRPTKQETSIVEEAASNKKNIQKAEVSGNEPEKKPEETSAADGNSLVKTTMARAGINEKDVTEMSDEGDSSTSEESDTTDTDSEDDEKSDDNDEDDDSASSSSSSSSSDSSPETTTSRRVAPDRVPPPSRKPATSNSVSKDKPEGANKPKSMRICRYFAKTGRCRMGQNCMFRHEMPMPKRENRSKRKGLYQILLEQQEEAENKEKMAASRGEGQESPPKGEPFTTEH